MNKERERERERKKEKEIERKRKREKERNLKQVLQIGSFLLCLQTSDIEIIFSIFNSFSKRQKMSREGRRRRQKGRRGSKNGRKRGKGEGDSSFSHQRQLSPNMRVKFLGIVVVVVRNQHTSFFQSRKMSRKGGNPFFSFSFLSQESFFHFRQGATSSLGAKDNSSLLIHLSNHRSKPGIRVVQNGRRSRRGEVRRGREREGRRRRSRRSKNGISIICPLSSLVNKMVILLSLFMKRAKNPSQLLMKRERKRESLRGGLVGRRAETGIGGGRRSRLRKKKRGIKLKSVFPHSFSLFFFFFSFKVS